LTLIANAGLDALRGNVNRVGGGPPSVGVAAPAAAPQITSTPFFASNSNNNNGAGQPAVAQPSRIPLSSVFAGNSHCLHSIDPARLTLCGWYVCLNRCER
jgi:hypothetical protein